MKRQKFFSHQDGGHVCIRAGRPSHGRRIPHISLRHRSRIIRLLLVAIVLLRARHSLAGSYDFNDTSWQGTSELLNLARERLGKDRVAVVASVDPSHMAPADAIMVLHPKVLLRFESLGAFMSHGGRVAVLDDFGRSGPFFDRFGIGRQNPPIHPKVSLRNNSSLAWAVPSRADAAAADNVHPMVAGLQRVLTNHPLTLTSSTLTPVLEIQSANGGAQVLAYSGIIEKRGRLFAMADPSVFINLMLRYPENRLFAERLMDYLVQDDQWGHRSGRLYLVANEFMQLDSAADDIFSRQFARDAWERSSQLLRQGIPEPIAWILALVVALYSGRLVFLYVARRGGPGLPRFSTPIALLAHPGEAGRAAVLAAPQTSRALSLLELDAGLRSILSTLPGLEVAPADATIVTVLVDRKVVDESQRGQVEWYLAFVKRVQQFLVLGRKAHVARAELERAHRLALDIAHRIDHRQLP